ncbi:HDOD domain-containing protein [Nitrosomonas sp. PY1]|uniref:HDOD domain-containing protein n=1 Tax=Nitrosomonas sp. PY1 TaxID=1803906 RepID=UPI001FC8546A|nr:HDOD domain-containing protein [Nitrosomonas sp. PY1]GKS68344.1 HDOD domain-containing protein [Nitrosomonas sp. PY1]
MNTRYSLKEQLLKAIDDDLDLPSLGGAITQIVKLSMSEDESIRQLSHFILSDVSLTQKILRLSNSVAFRSSSNQVVTSITKAVFLLGFETVKACALTILLVDKVLSGKHAEFVRSELIEALAASMLCQQLAKHNQFNHIDEVAITALFKNIGRLLLAAYEPEKYQEIMVLAKEKDYTPELAARKLYSFNLSDFTETILEKWNIPTCIIQATRNRPSGTLSPAKNKQEWIQQAAEFGEATAQFAINASAGDHLSSKNDILVRFGKAFNLDMTKLDLLIQQAAIETTALRININLFPDPVEGKESSYKQLIESEQKAKNNILAEFTLTGTRIDEIQITKRYASGKPYNSTALLLSAIQDVVETIATGNYKLNDLMLLILEYYYNSLGFRFITLCLRDTQKNQYRARTSFGKNSAEFQKAFHFPAAPSVDLFYLAMEKDSDLLISDAKAPKVLEMLPQWHRTILPDARSFIVLPLVLNKKPIGFIYGDREFDASEGITHEEIRLIKVLKSQVLAILNAK